MANSGSTFSESWHRVAGLRLSLRSSVNVRMQRFRGEKWYVFNDPFNNSYFRVRPRAYDFLIRLTPSRTVEEVWELCLDLYPDSAPGQEDVIQLLTQLYHANLLYTERTADTQALFDRFRKRKQQELQSRLLSIMFMRLPLLDPNRFLTTILPLIRKVLSPAGGLLWLAIVGWAVKTAIDHAGSLGDQAQGILAPGNLFLLYIGLVFVKTFHEFGHAAACRRFGGEVHTMGVMLLVFTPLPYVDATSSWSFRNPWERAFVGAAGMIAELFVAALCTFVWANTGQGAINSLAYNIMFIASVSTLLFNGNPLLRFDGYYILSDILDIPNLSTQSNLQLRHVTEKYLFGCVDSKGPAQSDKEAFLLSSFGILSGLYRVTVFTGIILFVADKFLLAGLVMALVCVVSWVAVPLYRFFNYLTTDPVLERTRERAYLVSGLILGSVLFFLMLCPFPNRFRAPGILEAVHYIKVVNDAPGYLEKVHVESGAFVEEGTVLMTFTDRELEIETSRVKAQKSETEALLMKAMSQEIADIKPLEKRLEAVNGRLADLDKQNRDLVLTAKQRGLWVAPTAAERVGSYFPKATYIGEIVDPSSFRFTTIVSQDDAASLFGGKIQKAEVRIKGHAGEDIKASGYRIIPFEQKKLPSAALGWLGGGDIAVSTKDDTGTLAAESFFTIEADLPFGKDIAYFQGRGGKIRFTMQPEPLVVQGWRALRRLLQKRYRV
jgi:putative peptide zinc metalloprotease protein